MGVLGSFLKKKKKNMGVWGSFQKKKKKKKKALYENLTKEGKQPPVVIL